MGFAVAYDAVVVAVVVAAVVVDDAVVVAVVVVVVVVAVVLEDFAYDRCWNWIATWLPHCHSCSDSDPRNLQSSYLHQRRHNSLQDLEKKTRIR